MSSKAYMRKYRKENPEKDKNYQKVNKLAKRQYVTDYLQTHPCIDCGETDIIVLEFDHVRGVKRKNISNLIMQTYSLQTLMEEIQKCEVRCANCHRRVTHNRRKWTK